jgi:hypothetical protein
MGRIAFADVQWLEGQDNMPGLVGNKFFIPRSEIDITALTIAADGVTLVGNPTLKPGGRITEIYSTENSDQLVDSDQGEIDGKYTQNMLTFFTPSSYKELESFKRAVRNTPGVWFFKDTKGNMRVMGIYAEENPDWTEGSLTEDEFIPSLDIPARVNTMNGTSGTRGGDRKGTTFEIMQDAPHAALFLDGVLPSNGS